MILLTVSPTEAVELLNENASSLIRSWKVPLGTAYICCAKPKKKYRIGCMGFFSDELYRTPKGEIKFGDSVELMAYDDYDKSNFLSGKVVAKCEINSVMQYPTLHQAIIYLSNISVLDKPMEIGKFKPIKKAKYDGFAWEMTNAKNGMVATDDGMYNIGDPITRAPSRWQKVVVGE